MQNISSNGEQNKNSLSLMDWIKGLIWNSKNMNEYDKDMKKAGEYNSQGH